MHDRVADQSDLENVLRIDARTPRDIASQLTERTAHGGSHLHRPAWIHHRVGDATHEIFSEADLRIHDTRRSDELTALQIAQVRGDGRRADVHRHAEHTVIETWPDGNDLRARVHCDSDLPLSRAQCFLQHVQDIEIAGESGETPFRFERVAE